MPEKERIHDILAYKIIRMFGNTFKARLMDKLPLYKDAAFCDGVKCYVASTMELRRSERLFDSQVLAWIKSFRTGDVFYDIGANIGMFSLTAAKLHEKKVKVYAFEPSFSTFSSLVHNVVANQFGDVIHPFSTALGSYKGLRNFNYTDLVSGASVHTLDAVINQTGVEFSPVFSQQTISYSLDDLVADFGLVAPTHVKIDVDGGESDIIEGMKRILQGNNIKSLMVEITENEKDDPKVAKIFDAFAKSGFKQALKIKHGGFKSYPLVYDMLFTKNWEMSNV